MPGSGKRPKKKPARGGKGPNTPRPRAADPKPKNHARQFSELQARLADAEETLRAIRSGEVDALVVSGPQGDRLYTLQGADESYRMLVEGLEEGAVAVSLDGVVLYCNRRFADMLGRSLEEVVAHPLEPLIAERDRRDLATLLRDRRGRKETTLVTAAGPELAVQLTANPLTFDGMPGVGLVVTDLTQRKRYEDVVAAERLARSIIDQATEAIVVCDERGGVIRASQAARDLCGGDPVGREFSAAFPLTIPVLKEDLATLALAGATVQGREAAFETAEGEERRLLVSAGPLLGRRGQIAGCILTLTDITRRKLAEELGQAMNRISDLIHSTLDLDEIMRRVISEAAKAIGSDTAAISLRREGGWEIGHVYGLPETAIGRRMTDEHEPHAVLAIQTRKPVVIDDALTDPRVNHEHMKIWGIRSVLVVPLVTGDEAVGVLFFNHHHRAGGFCEAHVDFADKLGKSVSLAIQNTRLVERLRVEIGERKRAAEALFAANTEARRRTAEVDAVFTAIPDPVSFYDADGRLRKSNAAFAALMGEDPVGATDAELAAIITQRNMRWDDDRPLTVDDLPGHRALRLVSVHGQILRLTDPAGVERTIEANATRIATGGAVSVLHDITERKRAEEALQHEQSFLRRVIDTTPSMIFVKDLDSRFVLVNEPLARAYGTGVDAIVGKSDVEFNPDAEQVAHFHRDDQEVISGQRTKLIVEEPVRHADGQVRWYTTIKVPLVEEDGTCSRLLGVATDITERKRAEERLSADIAALTRMHALSTRTLEAKGLPSLLQDIMDAAVVVVGARKGTLQLIEGDSLRIVAHHGHQRPFLEFFENAESRASVCGEAMKHRQRVIVEDVECSPLFAGTSSLDVLLQAGVRAVQSTPLVSRDGELLGILTTQWDAPHAADEHDLWRVDLLARQAADLIERTRAELAVEAARSEAENEKNRLAAVMETLPVGVALVDRQGGNIRANPAFEQVWGGPRPPTTSVGDYAAYRAWWADTGKPVEPEEWASARAVLKGETVVRQSLQIQRFDGQRAFVLNSAAPIRDSHGEITGAAVAIVDVTEMRAAEEAGRKLSRAVEQSPSSVVITDLEGIIEYVNPQFTRVTGYTPEEALGKNPRILKTEHTPPETFQELWSTLKAGGEWHGEFCNRKKNGELYWESASISPITDAEGRTTHYVAVKIDITERKKGEEELARYRGQLEQLVEHRTRQLRETQEELVRKERLATLGQLIGTVSHEIRNPLGTVRTSLYSVAERVRGRGLDVEKTLERAERSIERCDVIIEELLDYTRSSRALTAVQTTIDDWLAGILDEQPVPEGIVVHRELASGVRLMVDSERLRRCIINLLSNAFQAVQVAKRHDGLVTVAARHANRRLEIAVADNGTGISEEDLAKVFEPLYSTRSFGIGLGLCVVKQVMELHGGGVDLQTRSGEGTTATLWLPLNEADDTGAKE